MTTGKLHLILSQNMTKFTGICERKKPRHSICKLDTP